MEPAFDALWVTTDSVLRVNPATLDVRRVLPLPASGAQLGSASIAADRDHLWVGTADGMLYRLDPSGRVDRRRGVTDQIQLVAAGEDTVWVADQFASTVVQIDPGSLEPIVDVPIHGNIDAIEVMRGYLWTLDFGTGVLARIPIGEDRIVGQVTVRSDPSDLSAGADAIWVSHADGTITRVDPVTLAPSAFAHVEGEARAIAVDDDRESVWVDVTTSA